MKSVKKILEENAYADYHAQKRLEKIRAAEKESHVSAYTQTELYTPGSWLQKPIKTVLDILPLFCDYKELRVLDLGGGVGRNECSWNCLSD